MFKFASLIFQFLGGPVAKAMVAAYKEHLTATTTDKQTAATLAGQEIGASVAETQAITSLKIAQIGHPWEIEKLFAYVTLFYYAKLLIWDKVLGLGSTDPLTGWVLWAANLVIGFYFTKRAAENVSTIITAIRR
jgi:hypothetical protein